MNFTDFYQVNVLSEMLVTGDPKKRPAFIVAFDKWIWIFDYNEIVSKEVINDILNKVQFEKVTGIDRDKAYLHIEDKNDVVSFIQTLVEYIEDILIGEVEEDNILRINNIAITSFDPKSSVLVKKVATALKVKSVTYPETTDAEKSTTVPRKKLLGIVPDVGYHGTSSKYIHDIVRMGLQPDKSKSNWDEITHEGIIFFSTRIGTSIFHAVRTSTLRKYTRGLPIIVEFKIPDKNRLIADYDVENLTNRQQFYNYSYADKKKVRSDKPFSLSKEFGIYGYRGNIKPVFITNIYVYNNQEKMGTDDVMYASVTDFKKMKPKSAEKHITELEELGFLE